jgi:hypothetical protein
MSIIHGGRLERFMRLVQSLIERLKNWVARYNAALSYAAAKDRLRPLREWNGKTVGELRRPLDTQGC